MLVLGIETSCDDTSIAIVRDGREILANIISSQVDIHAITGGVVPEIAARKHAEKFTLLLNEALAESECSLSDIDLIAVTNRPGLIGALMVGVTAAKTLAWQLHKPIIAVHHLTGHMAAVDLAEPMEFPYICLVVSGGHTELLEIKGWSERVPLGRTLDDAAGEAFDKAARLLGLGYPGGPVIDKAAATGNPLRLKLPRARLDDSLNFSFSGLKTALYRELQKSGADVSQADYAASFREAVVDVLVSKSFDACARTGCVRLGICGGVAANSRLKERMLEEGEKRGIHVVVPRPVMCTDNAAMIAAAGYWQFLDRGADDLSFDAKASEVLVLPDA